MRRHLVWKPFTSFLVFFAFTFILGSGLVLYIAPPGRIANWTVWMFGSLPKEQWQAIHTVFAFVFVVAAVLHLILNWRVLVAYLRTRLHTGTSNRREFVAAGAVTLTVLAMTMGSVPPFSTIVDIGDRAKNSWADSTTEPPVPHAEGLTLAQLADVTKQPVDQLLQKLSNEGVRDVADGVTVGELASRNGLTPQALYVKTRTSGAAPVVNVEAGLGRKNVEQVCAELGIGLDDGLARLERAGLRASADDTMKDIANVHGRTPHDILPILKQ